MSHTASLAMVIPIMRFFVKTRLSHSLYPSGGWGVSMNGLIILEILAGCPMRMTRSFRSFRS